MKKNKQFSLARENKKLVQLCLQYEDELTILRTKIVLLEALNEQYQNK